MDAAKELMKRRRRSKSFSSFEEYQMIQHGAQSAPSNDEEPISYEGGERKRAGTFKALLGKKNDNEDSEQRKERKKKKQEEKQKRKEAKQSTSREDLANSAKKKI